MSVRRLAVRLRALANASALIALGGCATFGGNVKGSFSCAAPDGICAPTSSIDDRALAMIAGEAGNGEAAPASRYRQPGPKTWATQTATTGQRVPLGRVDARRTQERVLRIVFQPYIDRQGRLHEASAIHAVVQRGEWEQQVRASATVIPGWNAQAVAAAPLSLADAVDRADPGGVDVSAIDPNLPDAAVVSAARARAADPVAAIKSDVAARLVPKVGRTPLQSIERATRAGVTVQNAGAPVRPAAPQAASIAITNPLQNRGNAADAQGAAPILRAKSGSDAVARVKASPEYQAGAEQPGQAATPGVDSAQAVTGKATQRAAGFPSTVPEDK
ncbi:MAG TPA: type IV conjugative transfer system lipoprotein TraV [Sphingobium sp.]|uniref:type IV conjugative transfer system lipoprotein TraV n=1 Tax=Sphingobium sp. TaxID=1912891 RepID=UPI002ED523E7